MSDQLPYVEFLCGHRKLIASKERFAVRVLTDNPYDLDPIDAGGILTGERIQIDSPQFCPMCIERQVTQP